jgi:hypothetical protein
MKQVALVDQEGQGALEGLGQMDWGKVPLEKELEGQGGLVQELKKDLEQRWRNLELLREVCLEKRAWEQREMRGGGWGK